MDTNLDDYNFPGKDLTESETIKELTEALILPIDSTTTPEVLPEAPESALEPSPPSTPVSPSKPASQGLIARFIRWLLSL